MIPFIHTQPVNYYSLFEEIFYHNRCDFYNRDSGATSKTKMARNPVHIVRSQLYANENPEKGERAWNISLEEM
jgi:hypothetical protein